MPSLSDVVRFRDGSLMRVYLAEDERWRIWTPLEQIDPLLVQSTIAYEDRYFRWHPGVNPFALLRATWQNLRAGRVLSGGSTLTMQLARLIEPKPRTVRGKLHEMFRAMQYELRFGKKHILELYLNRAPYGGNHEGVAAASLAYFGKPPNQLFPAEVAYLVSLPQAPAARQPSGVERSTFDAGHAGSGSALPLTNAREVARIAARNRVLARMRERELISDDDWARGVTYPVPRQVHAFPARAPHAADYLRRRTPHSLDTLSTLDADIQQRVTNIAQSHTARLRELGAYNASVVVVDNRSREVRALVGSLDYWDARHGGQILGFDALRSPGSALKPFLYTLALQSGRITPETALEDVPSNFSGFQPENFSGKYRGLVRAETALSLSLNYPFVKLLQQTGYRQFLALLGSLGLEHSPGREYGLTLITGGMEVSLLNLTNAYVTLARGGSHAPVRIDQRTPIFQEKRLFDPGAVSLCRRALALRDRPSAPAREVLARTHAEVYWKTGTSWGRRDAWSLGFTPDYTVGVWVGNFSGQGSDGIVGAKAAGPILFDLLAALGSSERALPLETDYLQAVEVCTLSGLPPNPYCPETETTWAVRDRVPGRRCTFHRAILVEKATGEQAKPWRRYRAGELEQRTQTVLPPLVARVMGSRSRDGLQVAGYGSTRNSLTRNSQPVLKLARPVDGMSYLVTQGMRAGTGIPLQAWTDTPDGQIFWFIDQRFVQRSRSGETHLLSPRSGRLHITATDSAGNLAHAEIEVQEM